MSSRRTISNTFTVTTMDDPVSVQAQYSPDKKVVHTVWQDGDLYMRTKQSNETTWSSWHKIVGESGGETDYQFALSANLVTQDGTSATAPSDISSSAWQDAPMATTTQKPYLWSKVQKKDGNGNNVGSATYIRLTGEEGKDGLSPNPNILLRTVFDRGIDKVKEKWEADWSYVGIDETSDTIVDGRKCIRINASSLSTFKDFSQDVYGKLKTSTWYTLSFDFFSTHNFTTFICDGDNSSGIVDRTAGCYIDGVFQSLDLGIDGSHEWTASWYNDKRHSISFKTKSSFGTAHAYILFRCPSGAQLAICMPKLELGENATTYIANEDDLIGNEGIRGKIGRFFYYAGAWNDFASTDSFLVNDAQAPYFAYNSNYWVFNPETNGTYTKQDMGTPSSSSSNWKLMTDDFKYIITEAIFGSYAHFGSWIFNSDYMLSEKDGSGNPRGQQTYNGMGESQLTTGFIPSIAFDASNGRASFGGDKVRFQPNGAGWLANKNIDWGSSGNLTVNGIIKATLMYANVSTMENEQTGTGTYEIDLINYPAYMFIVPKLVYSTAYIKLPYASNYEGVELRFYLPLPETRVFWEAVLQTRGSEKIVYPSLTDITPTENLTTKYTLPQGRVVTLKSMKTHDNMGNVVTYWFVICGYQQRGLNGEYQIGGKSVRIEEGRIISIT